MKMYILVRDKAPLGIAMASVAHASLACYLKYQSDPDMQAWINGPFNKVVCKVNDVQFAEAKNQLPKHVVMTEAAWKRDEVSVAFCPRENWPPVFSSYIMYQ
jgi:peptidyl-tRNA hydrolase